jgi:DNA-binding transcriptional MerR regulator
VQGLFEGLIMNADSLTIGALAARTSCNIPTIRYYEEIGLLPPAQRAANGHRCYRVEDLKRLTFIKRCRDFGFPIEQVRELVHLFEDGDRACVDVRDMAQLHLDALKVKMDEMRGLEASLVAFVNSCDAACSGGLTRNCAIIEDLSALDLDGKADSCCARAEPTMSHTAPRCGGRS